MQAMNAHHSSVAKRGTFSAEVLANESVCDEHFRLILDLRGFGPTGPGQFVQLLCSQPPEQGAYRQVQWADGEAPQLAQAELLGHQPLLRRPFSIAGRRDRGEATELDIIYRVKGAGTSWLSTVRPGQRLSVLGPLGNRFTLRPDKPQAVLIGGGVGIPPLLYLAEALQAAGVRTVAFVGALSAGHLPLRLLPTGQPRPDGRPSHCVAELAAYGVDTAVATDDGSVGFAGVVSEPVSKWLKEGDITPDNAVIYSCGPEVMMQAVAPMALAAGIECQLSLERYMACGMGTCQSCVCKIRDDSAQGWSFRLCCSDGPVFTADEIIWD